MSTYGYDSYYNMSSMAETIVGGLLIFFLIIILISLAIAICTIVGQWRAFKKAGKGGWEAIIPIYNQIVLCQIVGVNPWWILIVAVGGMVLSLIPVLGPLCSLALSIYFAVLLNVSAARSFGKSDGFAAGLIFLAPIFWLILGSNKTQYVGVTPMYDVVLNFVNDKFGNSANNTTNNMNNNSNQNMNNSTQATNIKFCTSCGYKMLNNERFCPSCGKESK